MTCEAGGVHLISAGGAGRTRPGALVGAWPPRAGAGLDLADDAGGHGGPDDVVAAVVLISDALKGLRVAGESADPAVLFPFYKRRRLANVLSDVMGVARTKSGINTDVSLGLNCKLPSVSADEVAIYARELSLYEGVQFAV